MDASILKVHIAYSFPKRQKFPTSYFHLNMQDKPQPAAQIILHA